MKIYSHGISHHWICPRSPSRECPKPKQLIKGLRFGAIEIPVKDGELPAYYAQPESGDNFTIILVIQDFFGVHEHLQDIVHRFAKLGYLAITPELFARQGDVSKLIKIEEIRAIVAKVPDAQVLSDLDATLDWAVKS